MRIPTLADLEDDDVLTEEQRSFVARAVTDPLAPAYAFRAITLPAPAEALEKFMRLVPRDSGFLWRSPNGTHMACGGCVHEISVTGEDRFVRLREQLDSFWSRIETRLAPGGFGIPAVVGGLAFAPHVPSVGPWEEFASDSFGLPRWTYRRRGSTASLTLTLLREEIDEGANPDVVLDEIRSLLRSLEYESPTSRIDRFDIPRSAIHQMPAEDWTAYIRAIQDAIASGQFDKIVAARRCVVDLEHPVEDTGLMARLYAAYPDCTQFAVRRPNSTFLGATPETLFVKQGRNVKTHALAGTARVKDDMSVDSSRDAARLTRSEKDLSEHGLVVKKICEDLWSFCTRIRYGSSPQARRVRNLVHLQTPITAELRPEVHALELADTLHPTPAVGGFPSREAADWLRRNEPQERGWFTGIVGWVDAEGDAEFGVAIRCGVITRERAYVFAGAGIVKDSKAESEYAETAGKMQPMLRALGVKI